MSTTNTITVTGMTCDHCVRAVRDEVSAIQGVTNVEVDLASGQVTIEAATELEALVPKSRRRKKKPSGNDAPPPA